MSIERGAFKAALLDHAAEQAGPVPAHYGARELTPGNLRAIEATPLERPVVRPWARSAAAAIRIWVRVLDEGAALRSTCDPDRANRVQTSADPSLGGREHDAIERVATVSRAVRDAGERVVALNYACPLLTPDQAMNVGLISIAGIRSKEHTKMHGQPQKNMHWVRKQVLTTDVVRDAQEAYGVRIDESHVASLASHILAVVEAALVASGEAAWPPRDPPPTRRWDPTAKLRAQHEGGE